MKKILIDVRQFALPVPTTGSIETHSGFGAPPLDGQEIHQIIQRKRQKEKTDYQIEKKLSHSFSTDHYQFVVSGRVDGLIENADGSVIEEIKSAFDIEALSEKLLSTPAHPYFLQLKTYGYFYFREKNQIPLLQLCLVSARNLKSRTLIVDFDPEEFEQYVEIRLKELEALTRAREKHFHKRLKCSKKMLFPFSSPRRGQMELMKAVTTHCDSGDPLLIQAPTGLGKTAGVLFPALKNALSRGQKVIYVTPKNSQHLVAEEAVSLMQQQDIKIKSFTLTAKSKMCLKEEQICQPNYCEYARDHYTKVAEHSLIESIRKKKRLTAKALIKMGQEYKVCPFELSLEAIETADVVIADYNYVFSPRSLIGRLSEPFFDRREKPNLVIDEAHNLPSRSQDYFSATLHSRTLLPFIEKQIPGATEALNLLRTYKGANRLIRIDPAPFIELNQKIKDLTMDYLDSDGPIESRDPVIAFSNLFNDFTTALSWEGEEFFHSYQSAREEEWLKITCCDASTVLARAYKEFHSTIAFSATLKPFDYYSGLLGLKEAQALEFESPFARENRKVMLIPQVSTRYNDRQNNVPKICSVIEKIMAIRSGNYMAVFPSFEFMNMVSRNLTPSDDYRLIVQPKEIKSRQTNEILETLKTSGPALLLAVQGGVFTEGVDYPGDMLIGAFIIGPALPHFDFEREQIRQYYQQRFGEEKAFDYAYVYPAMARAVQSAGRVIRTENDKGLIILLDSRFKETNYTESMPQGWYIESIEELVSTQIIKDIQNFWEQA